MARIALLIGIKEYGTGIGPVTAAPADVFALQEVLKHRQIGYFHHIQAISDECKDTNNTAQECHLDSNGHKDHVSHYGVNLPANGIGANGHHSPIETNSCERSSQTIPHGILGELIQSWCRSHEPDDLTLFFFSGKGFRTITGELYLATSNTYLDRGSLVDAAAIPVYSLVKWLNQSCSRQQIVILDCCFDAATGEPLPTTEDNLDLEMLLGAEHRVVLSACTQANYSVRHKSDRLSLYTRYLVEGIMTGFADNTGKGWVSAADIHHYVTQQMKIAVPNIIPLIIDPGAIATTIPVAKVDTQQEHQQYCQAVQEHCNVQGISQVGRHILDLHQRKGWVSAESGEMIEQQVLHPYNYYSHNLGHYRHTMTAMLTESDFTPQWAQQLAAEQRRLGLRPEDVNAIDAELAYLQQLRHGQEYRQALRQAMATEQPLSDRTKEELELFQKMLGLDDEDVHFIQQEVMADRGTHRQRLAYYRHHFMQAIEKGFAINSLMREELNILQRKLYLSDADVDMVERDVSNPAITSTNQPPQESRSPETRAMGDDSPPKSITSSGPVIPDGNNSMTDPNSVSSGDPLPSSHSIANSENPPVEEQYELALRAAFARQLPINEGDRQTLERLQTALNLSNQQVRSISQRVKAEIEEHERKYHDTKIREYEELFAALLESNGTVSPSNRALLEHCQLQLGLHDADIGPLEKHIIAHYRSKAMATPPPSPSPAGAAAVVPLATPLEFSLPQPRDIPPSPSPFVTGADAIIPTALEDPTALSPVPLMTLPPPKNLTKQADASHELSAEDALPEQQPGEDALLGQQPDDAPREESPNQHVGDLGIKKNIDYTQLETYLKNGEWQKADEETLVIMLKATDERVSWMSPEAIRKLPCKDLATIDHLWQHYSSAKFSFTKQQIILQSIESKGNRVAQFGSKVGWNLLNKEFVGFKYYNQLTFNLANAPDGHLPARWFWKVPWWESLRSGGLGSGRGGCGEDAANMLSTIMERLHQCRELS